MASDLIGDEVLGYQILEMIGEGGMASVWRARHKDLDTKLVAIKIMDPGLARNQEMVARFVDEARIQVKLKHENIVGVENFCREPPAMVLELVAGRPLSQVIGKEVGPMAFDRALPMMRKIMSAVGYAHDQGVVHRDLKPSNVLVDPDDGIKVMDFGIAKVLGSEGRTRTGATMGTPAYMAPEQIKGAKDVDERADIYALGITFYEMLAGQTPFEKDKDTDSEFALMEAQVHRDPPDPRTYYPGVPGEAVGVIMRALAKLPGDRFQTVHEMAAAMEQVAPATAAGPPPAGGSKPARTVIENDVRVGACLSLAPLPSPTVVETGPDPGYPGPGEEMVPNLRLGPCLTVPPGYPGPGAGGDGAAANKRLVLIIAGVAAAVLLVVGLAVALLLVGQTSSDQSGDMAAVVRSDEPPPEALEPQDAPPVSDPAAASSSLPTAADASTIDEGKALIENETRTPSSHVVTLARQLFAKFGPEELARRQMAKAVNTRGFRLYKAGQLDLALTLHKAAAEMDYTYGMPRFGVAKIYAVKGDVDNCVKYLQQIKSMQTDHRLNRIQRNDQIKRLKLAKKHPDFRKVWGNPKFEMLYR